MKGFPKTLATKTDYENVRQLFPKEDWLPYYKELLEYQNEWFFVKYLEDEEKGISDDTHRIIEEETLGTEKASPKRAQYEFKYNPNCRIAELGYTNEEVKAIIKEAEEA